MIKINHEAFNKGNVAGVAFVDVLWSIEHGQGQPLRGKFFRIRNCNDVVLKNLKIRLVYAYIETLLQNATEFFVISPNQFFFSISHYDFRSRNCNWSLAIRPARTTVFRFGNGSCSRRSERWFGILIYNPLGHRTPQNSILHLWMPLTASFTLGIRNLVHDFI